MSSQRHYDRHKRDKESVKFYKSKAWRSCRDLALIRDDFLCQSCLKRERITPAEMVHHIKEFKDHPELALVLENLVSLCLSCHNKEHPHKGPVKETKKRKRVRVLKMSSNPELEDEAEES